jgi:hypothetical protein
VSDHCRRHIRLVIKKTAVLALKNKLDREAEFAGIDPAGEQYQVLRQQRPALTQLVC